MLIRSDNSNIKINYAVYAGAKMSDKKDFDKSYLGFVIGGAILGAVAGYVVKKVGPKNIMNMVKQKDIIPPSITNLISEFSSKQKSMDE